jgi:putative transposase
MGDGTPIEIHLFPRQVEDLAFPDGHSALMLCADRLRHVAGSQWGSKRYLNMDLLHDQDIDKALELVEAG